MIDKNYNEKFRKFFRKFSKQYELAKNENEKKFLWDLAVDYVEKNRDFVMQYPIVQYWENINEKNYEKLEKDFFKEYNNKELNLYFHIPFCKTRCTYCNFHIIVWDKSKELMSQVYISKLKKEIDLFLENVSGFKIKTIFIWWWTPSYLDEKYLEDLLKYINTKLWNYFKEDIEFSFEWNPDSFNNTKLKILKKYNINRLSIWVQTFNNEVIKNINRTYTEKSVYEIVKLSKKIWFENINIDMIYWLPWQDYKIMRKDLDIVSKLNIEHITYYPLYYYNEAIISKINMRENNIKQIYNFYDEIIKKLKNNNFNQYWREYFSKWSSNISHYQNNFVSNWILYGFWQSAYSFNEKYAFKKEVNLKKYLTKNNPLTNCIKYDSENLDRRLFVLWSRNIKINKNNIKNVENIRKLTKLANDLWLIIEKEKSFLLTKNWLKYQEILAHMFM